MTPPANVATKSTPASFLVNLIIGGLIGMAEMVPGVSGGTVALVTGIYGRAVRNGHALLHLVKDVLTRKKVAGDEKAKVEWGFILTVGVGMVATVLTLSSVMHDFVENSPETSRALFLGMVAVSLIVPIKMIDKADFAKRRAPAIALFITAAVFVFFLTGLTAAEKPNPSLIVVFGAAAIAVCALVLPGVSGSFMLLAMGLYAPIMGAVADRDLKIMSVFILGAITGLALFIKTLDYLVTEHHTLTMITMAGFMLGSLRALWPWQDSQATMLAPGDNLGWIIAVFAIGGVIAGAIMLLERFNETHQPTK
ncbi:DUF368 domain-containing protein [Corynebacterium sp. SCR221107]|uniref:DUF368 domain-containing protein n=1 Tax=Corynebacterium sp. SCR221107 TaxID=3017361 RepID=UPI0022EC8EBB|nr:DUF368 domain-containing protein [Corynebacterium sp. SCR221107]WBT09897.1 DUF368 domain-containing protein [Corynebacterium sp. SCR221107]